MATVTRRRVTYGQLEKLWEFLNENKAIATGYNKTSQAREFWKKMWQEIAETLNSHEDGAKKDFNGWCKYWNDYKSKLKKIAATNRAAQTAGTPSQIKELMDVEKKFLQLLGYDFGNDLIGMKLEPFELSKQETESGLKTPIKVREPTILKIECCSESELTRSPGPGNEGMSPEIMEPGPSTRETPSPPVLPPPGRPFITIRPDLQRPLSPPRRPLRRRRFKRQEPPITQEAARQTLIRISERRANIEEQNCETLKNLLQEIREIKEILLLRSVEHPTDSV